MFEDSPKFQIMFQEILLKPLWNNPFLFMIIQNIGIIAQTIIKWRKREIMNILIVDASRVPTSLCRNHSQAFGGRVIVLFIAMHDLDVILSFDG